MFLGLDIGTSSVKAVLVDEAGAVAAEASAPLDVSRPQPLWSEQDPDAWVAATDAAVAGLPRGALGGVRAVGLSGQMHGAVLLDAADRPLRPAILWNDGRAGAECAELERRVPELHALAGNLAMPGFTAPKLLWAARHEPEVFAATRRVLLPKDYVRLAITGDAATDLSDASGTLWLDVGGRRWSERLLEATGLTLAHMPALHEGAALTGRLRPEVASRWGVPQAPVAAGGGDNACAAAGVGAVSPTAGVLSVGTSGVYFLPTETFRPRPKAAIHAFCHAVPGLWHQMAVTLSAASAFDWAARLLGCDVPALMALAEAVPPAAPRGLYFLPYLSGERTPHNDPEATGQFSGLTHATDRGDVARAVVEGVALALADASAPMTADAPAHRLALVGGGARSPFVAQTLADALGRPLETLAGAEVGPALGAARLARIALTGEPVEAVCPPPPVRARVEPKTDLAAGLPRFWALYRRGV